MTASAEKSAEAGAPGKEIEVTPEMIEAGAAAILACDRRASSVEDLAEAAYLAMEALARRTRQRGALADDSGASVLR